MTAGSTDSLIGRLIDGRYQVRSRIARGGMATVYLATDLRLERKVAIKIMHGHLSDDAKFRERFIQEARSAARLAHPNVVNVFDQGQDSDMAYLVMEYLPGITLRDLLQEHGHLTTDQTLDILEAVLSGLAAAHKAGIVHRDLKPENVLLADDGRIKIGDFGLARAASANTATGAALLGTIAYLSPELVTRGIADTRSDMYAVGIMTYEMVTGLQPFTGEAPMQIAYQHANSTVPAPGIQNPNVPEEIDDLVLWATSRDPDDRPRDARTMLAEVIAVRSSLDGPLPFPATASQRTMVMPEASAERPIVHSRGDTDETIVISPIRRPAAAAGKPDATPAANPGRGESARRESGRREPGPRDSGRRRRRGRWIIPVLVVLALIAGAGGWYFFAGPGAHVAVADVRGSTLSAARSTLVAEGLVVNSTTGSRYDPNQATNLVSGTSPAVGSSIVKGSRVTIILSLGPKLISLPSLTGKTEGQATKAIRAAHFLVGSGTIFQFDPKIDKGTVLDYLGQDNKSLLAATKYFEDRPITLVVSAGPLPDVSGMTVKDATSVLNAAGFDNVETGSETYSTTVKLGQVVSIDPQKNAAGVGRVFRKGQTQAVILITSRGPQMVTVPSNVVGMTWSQAKPLLSPDFTLVYDHNADVAPGLVTVTAVSPGEGTSVVKGSKLTITFNFQ